jgi:hypothetical protein
MRLLCCLLFPAFLAAQRGPLDLSLDLYTGLGADPLAQICLAPPGCWDGLVAGMATRPPKSTARTPAGATVEVWDLAYRDRPRHEAFGLYLDGLRERLSRAFAAPPPRHGAIELSDLVSSDPSNPQKLDLTKVKSMQDRFNRLPPNGSPVKPVRP